MIVKVNVDVELEAEVCDITYTFLHDSFIPLLTICPPSEKKEEWKESSKPLKSPCFLPTKGFG